MSFLSDKFIQHVASQLNIEVSDFTKACSSFESNQTSTVKTSTVKKASSGTSTPRSVGGHTCERMINKRDTGLTRCGKNAKRQLGDCWYCGTDKSGCYKTMLSRQNKKSLEAAKEAIERESMNGVVEKTPLPKRVAKTPAVLNRFKNEKGPFHARKIVTDKYGEIYWNPPSRMVVEKVEDGVVVQGLLGDDNNSIEPLDKKSMANCSQNNLRFLTPDETITKYKPEQSVKNDRPESDSEMEESDDELSED